MEMVRRDSLKGRRGRLSSKARCQLNEHVYSSYGNTHTSGADLLLTTSTGGVSMGLRKPGADLINMDRRYVEPVGASSGPRMNSSSSASCTVSSTVTLLSMLTKAYDLVGPSSSSAASKSDGDAHSVLDMDLERMEVCPKSDDAEFALRGVNAISDISGTHTKVNNAHSSVVTSLAMTQSYLEGSAHTNRSSGSSSSSNNRNNNSALPGLTLTDIREEVYPSCVNTWANRDNGTMTTAVTTPMMMMMMESSLIPAQPTSLGPTPVYRLENGQLFRYEDLYHAGVGGWARQLWETGMQIRTLVQGDWSAVAGLAALILVNYKSINYGPMMPVSSRVDSTYFSRVFQQKYLIRSMTRTLLLLPLMQMIESEQLRDPWLKEIIDLMGNSE
ncbi:unnamed protein product [Echinostoma caproni]|uniref:ELMO domain-containing protein n=1 Tax=Echinostoma caproni TaxID=27848 RepID=A0A183AME0_9TREM|nr:unnamed protein product [Echinostoma caproni]